MSFLVLIRVAHHHVCAGAQITTNVAGEVGWAIPSGFKCCFAIGEFLHKATALTFESDGHCLNSVTQLLVFETFLFASGQAPRQGPGFRTWNCEMYHGAETR